MSYHYDVKRSQFEAKRDVLLYNKSNYIQLLQKYCEDMDRIRKYFGGLETNIPPGNEYFAIKNKYQYVHSYFTKGEN